jgi:hypothetical protein
MTLVVDPSIIHGVIGQTGTDVVASRYSTYTTRKDPTVTGRELMVHQVGTTEEGVTTLAGGSKKEGGLMKGHKTAAYP